MNREQNPLSYRLHHNKTKQNEGDIMKIRFLLFGIIALLAVGCGTFFDDISESNLQTESNEDMPVDSIAEESTESDYGEDRSSHDKEGYASEPLAPPPAKAADGDMVVLGELDALPDVGGGIAGTFAVESDMQQVTTLKAGEIDDNADWDEYLLYRREALENFGDYVNDVDVTGRTIITITDENRKPIHGALVTITRGDILISQTRTYANGQTLFLPNANPNLQANENMIISIEKDGVSSTIDMSVVRMGPNWEFGLDMQAERESVKLDVVFLLDATGSMSDEIGQLQQNILSISEQIDAMGDIDVRYGLVHYRDRDDAYVTQVHEFTPDVTAFQTDLNRVRAEGGGDTPESLNAGLHDALHSVEWRGDDTIKLVFLVADAPPHLDYEDDFDYADEILYAGQEGIKIHPIASSGLDPVGEYIFRQIGQTTMGRFIFLTYADGVPGEAGDERTDLEAGEQDYTVDFLDGLVVQLIEDEINAYKGISEE